MEGQVYNGTASYNAAQAFSQVCATNVVNNIATQNNVIMSASNPGLPQDSFRRENTFISSRYTKPASAASNFFKSMGSIFSSVGMVSKIVAFFYPPAAAVSTVAEMASPVMTSLAGDDQPKPVTFTSMEKYNPWLR